MKSALNTLLATINKEINYCALNDVGAQIAAHLQKNLKVTVSFSECTMGPMFVFSAKLKPATKNLVTEFFNELGIQTVHYPADKDGGNEFHSYPNECVILSAKYR